MLGESIIGLGVRGMQRNPGKRYNSREEFLAALDQARKDNMALGFSGEGFEDPDKWYFDAIEKYKGSALYDRLVANPHLYWNNEEFSPNLLQQFGEGLGDYQARMAYYEDLRNKANSYLTDQLNMISQQDYDSATGQVAREKLAGINPDINGGQGITPGAAAENDQPFAPPSVSSASSLAQISSMGVNFVSTVFSLAQGVFSMMGQSSSLVSQDIANHSSAMDLLYDEVLNTLPASDLSDEGIKNLDSAVLLRTIKSISNDTSFNRRTRKVLSRYADSLTGDAATAKMQDFRMQLANHYLQSKKGVVDTMSLPYYSEDLSKWLTDFSPYMSSFVEAALAEADASFAGSQNEIAYQNTLDPVVQAEGENESNRNMKAREGAEANTEEEFKKLTDFLKNDNSFWSKIALIALPELRALIRSFSGGTRRMSFNRRNSVSNQYQTVNKYGPTVVNN